MVAVLNFGILLFTGMIIYASLSKRALAAGKWYYKEKNSYKYWETLIGYVAFLMVLFFCRQLVIDRLAI